MTDIPTADELRAAGFAAELDAVRPRSDLAFRLLCAFNGVDPHQAPKAWHYYPNEWTADAWERVAVAALAWFESQSQT